MFIQSQLPPDYSRVGYDDSVNIGDVKSYTESPDETNLAGSLLTLARDNEILGWPIVEFKSGITVEIVHGMKQFLTISKYNGRYFDTAFYVYNHCDVNGGRLPVGTCYNKKKGIMYATVVTIFNKNSSFITYGLTETYRMGPSCSLP